MKYAGKAVLIAGLLVLVSSSVQAQDTVRQSTYLLTHFTAGSVLLKSGRMEPAYLNYDAERQGIAFTKDGQPYNLTELEMVDTVYIKDQKFIPVQDVFYEVIAQSPVELYATYTCKMQPVTSTADNNGSSRKNLSQVSNTVSDVYLNRPYRAGYVMEFRKHFWLRRYHDYYKINSLRQAIKLFPRKEMAIKEFANTNKTDFNNQDDVIKFLSFCTK